MALEVDDSWSSWRSFSSLIAGFKKSRKALVYRTEISMLLDAVTLNKPLLLQQGYILYDLQGNPVEIHSLDELVIGKTYMTEKETGVVRADEDEIIVGGKLIIGAHQSSLVLKGTVGPDTALLALENHAHKKLSQGILFLEEDKGLCRIFYALDQLIPNTGYLSADGGILIKRLASGNIQFQLTSAPAVGKGALPFATSPPRQHQQRQHVAQEERAVAADQLRRMSKEQWGKRHEVDKNAIKEFNKENVRHPNGQGGVAYKIKTKLKSWIQPDHPEIELENTASYEPKTPASGETDSTTASPAPTEPQIPPPVPIGAPPPPPPKPPGPPPPPSSRVAKKKLKQLHWARIPVIDMDTNITTEQLIALSSILSTLTVQDVEAINAAPVESLTSVELFVKEMLSLSHVAERLNAWLLSRQLSAQLEDIAKGLSVVNTACEEVRNSASLKGILKLVLALGTVLNRGTYLDCQGFRLETLLKLEDTRAKSGQLTLLHYLVDVVQKEHPDLLQIHKELLHSGEAANIALDYLADNLTDNSEALQSACDLLPVENGGKGKITDAQFLSCILPFITSTKQQIELLTTQANTIIKEYEALALFYGEEPTKLSSKDFFRTISEFLQAFNRVAAASAIRKK